MGMRKCSIFGFEVLRFRLLFCEDLSSHRNHLNCTVPSFSISGIISGLSELDQSCAIIIPTVEKDGPAIYPGMHFAQHECSWQGWLT